MGTFPLTPYQGCWAKIAASRASRDCQVASHRPDDQNCALIDGVLVKRNNTNNIIGREERQTAAPHTSPGQAECLLGTQETEVPGGWDCTLHPSGLRCFPGERNDWYRQKVHVCLPEGEFPTPHSRGISGTP